jgi:hypothetical protein
MSAERPLPTLMPRSLVPMTPHSNILAATSAYVRDRTTGVWNARTLLLEHRQLFILKNMDMLIVRPKWTIELTRSTRVENGEDAFTLRIDPNDDHLAHQDDEYDDDKHDTIKKSETHEKYVHATAHILKAPTTELRDEWLRAIQGAIDSLAFATPRYPRMHAFSTLFLIRLCLTCIILIIFICISSFMIIMHLIKFVFFIARYILNRIHDSTSHILSTATPRLSIYIYIYMSTVVVFSMIRMPMMDIYRYLYLYIDLYLYMKFVCR